MIIIIIITLAALTRCYGLTCTSVTDFRNRAYTDFCVITYPSDP